MGKKRKKNLISQHNGFKPAFKGCVIIPLTDEDFDAKRIKYYGDWLNPHKHHRIMRKPRKYQLTFYFKGFDGERGVDQIRLVEKDDFKELTHYIESVGNELIKAIGAEKVDLKKSYVSIKA